MSWSVSYLGKAEKIVEALQKQSETLSDYSKEEYDAALPHMVALVSRNFNKNNSDYPLIRFSASGHGSKVNGEEVESNLQMNIEHVYSLLV